MNLTVFFWPRKILITDENYYAQHPGEIEKDKRGDDLKRQRKTISPIVKNLCSTCIFHKVGSFL